MTFNSFVQGSQTQGSTRVLVQINKASGPLCLQWQRGGYHCIQDLALTLALTQSISYATILLCRPQNEDQTGENCRWGNRRKAFDAANEITRITEDILADSAGRLCQIHT